MPSTRSLKLLRFPESRWTIIIVAMPLLSSISCLVVCVCCLYCTMPSIAGVGLCMLV